ncbi:19665_t:CDS:2, partial [Racocetra fulgida]
CINKFLNYCKELKKTDEKRGKILANALYGYLGKSKNVLAIRSDCIYVKGELPTKFSKEAEKYQKYKIIRYQQVGFFGDDNVFVYDNRELKSFANNPSERKKLMEEFLSKQLSKVTEEEKTKIRKFVKDNCRDIIEKVKEQLKNIGVE